MFGLVLYILTFLSFMCYLVVLILVMERMFQYSKKYAPSVPSARRSRAAVLDEIARQMPDVKSVLDIGSGWGGMARAIGRRFKNAHVTGIELMPTPYVFARVGGIFSRNAKFIFGDAFKFLEKSNKKFDIGIAYLLTPEMGDIEKIRGHFKMMLILDFPLPGAMPDEKIKLHKDFLGQHWLYVYKEKKKE